MADPARANDPRSEASKDKDLISRGDYTSTPLEKAVFFLSRSADPILQYSILAHGTGTVLFHKLGLRTLSPGLPAHTGLSIVDNLGLSPYRLALFGMSVAAAVKHDIWVTLLSGEPMTVKNALIIGTFNCVFNTMNSYAFLLRATSASMNSTFPPPALLVGGALFATGLVVELVAEIQRKTFKADPKNKGKAYTGGLWSFARHINYGAYTAWRAGYALAGGGWAMGAVVAAFFGYDFATRGVPILNEYCEKRYGEQWVQFKKQTQYVLFPGIY